MDDSIARQSAIETVHEAIYEFFDLVDDDAESPMTYLDKKLLEVNKAITNRLNNLPSAQPEPRWIPVTEKLPEANEKDELGFIKAYLVQDARWMDVARWNGEYWVAWGHGTVLKNVTAWMPLPEPYRKDGEQDETSD